MRVISPADIARGRTALVMAACQIERDVRLVDLTEAEEWLLVVAILEAVGHGIGSTEGIPIHPTSLSQEGMATVVDTSHGPDDYRSLKIGNEG